MPLLEVTQTRHLNATVKFADTTIQRINRYVEFVRNQTGIRVEADQILDKAANFAFDKDREFLDFEKTPEAHDVSSVLRVRKPPVVSASRQSPKPAAKGGETLASVAGSRA
jgi:hypothetical protein